MKWSIGKLYLQWGHPEFDFEKAVGRYLMELERCPAKVVIASPNYDQHYRCEIIADASGLLEWAEKHFKGCWSSDKDEQAARIALPIWLRGADPGNLTPANVPYYFYKVIDHYVQAIVNLGITEVFCPDCQSIVEAIDMKKLNERQQVNWHWWTDEWYCKKGHLLYSEDQELKFFCKLH
jgi:hypothetical protein